MHVSFNGRVVDESGKRAAPAAFSRRYASSYVEVSRSPPLYCSTRGAGLCVGQGKSTEMLATRRSQSGSPLAQAASMKT